MWKSLFVDMYQTSIASCKNIHESVVLGIHFFNISKGLQCTGLQEDNKEINETIPENWNKNSQLYSFRYSFKSVIIYQKLLRASSIKLNIYSACSDQKDNILYFSFDLSEILSDYPSSNFIDILIEKILIPYEKEVLLRLVEISSGLEEKPKLEKVKSILEDDSVPFGIPLEQTYGKNPYLPAREEEKQKLEKLKSILEDDIIPFGIPLEQIYSKNPHLPAREEEKAELKKTKSILEDDTVPFGIPLENLYTEYPYQSRYPYWTHDPEQLTAPRHYVRPGNQWYPYWTHYPEQLTAPKHYVRSGNQWEVPPYYYIPYHPPCCCPALYPYYRRVLPSDHPTSNFNYVYPSRRH